MAIKSGYTSEDLAKMGPDYLTKKRLLAEALLNDSTKQRKIAHPLQGLAQLAETLSNGMEVRRLDEAQLSGRSAADKAWGAIFGGSSSPSASSAPQSSQIPMTEAAGEVAATSPVTGDTYSPFMDAVKAGGLTNPYGLAAVAATGRAESGWSAKNANRTWSDPSESGKPGTAGGIMSWRGPRYQALAATGDLSPAGQAKFFLQEDPALIQKLQNAKSVEEAQQLMNNAWAFAGYNRPGGESSRRLGYAKGYLPQFQGGTEVASLTPGMPAPSPQPGGYVDPEISSRGAPPVPAQAPTPSPRPAGNQQLAQAVIGGNSGPSQEQLMSVINDPWMSEDRKNLAKTLLGQQIERGNAQYEQQLKQQDPAYRLGLEKSQLEIDRLRNPPETPADKLARERFEFDKDKSGKTADINEYEYAKERGYEGSFVDFQLAQKKAGASSTNVNVGEGDEFYKNLDKKNAETFSALSENGMGARSRLAQLGQLEGLLEQAPSGAEAGVKLWLGDMGINTDGLDGLQATRALVEKMVPEQRQAGSGPMSDADIVMYRRSLPSVINQPGGNQLIIGTAKAIAEYDMQMGDIADAVANREITAAEGRKQIRALKNPLEGYTEKMRALRKEKVAPPVAPEQSPEDGAILDDLLKKYGG